jgi:hypothetical protein
MASLTHVPLRVKVPIHNACKTCGIFTDWLKSDEPSLWQPGPAQAVFPFCIIIRF